MLGVPGAEASGQIAVPEDRWALIIGITNYNSPTKDTIAGARDAQVVRETLLRKGWRSDRIRILTERNATGQSIAEGLAWIVNKSREHTFSLVHYSGHVKQRDGHEFLWGSDNRYIKDTEAARVLKQIRGRVWFNVAACEAGGFDEDLASERFLFTGSSQYDEKSYEHNRWRMSVWTGLLFDQGMVQGHGDRDGDGATSVNEAVQWAGRHAPRVTSRQQPHGPQHPYWRGDPRSLRLDAPRV